LIAGLAARYLMSERGTLALSVTPVVAVLRSENTAFSRAPHARSSRTTMGSDETLRTEQKTWAQSVGMPLEVRSTGLPRLRQYL